MLIGYCSDIGKLRDENQDNFCIVKSLGLIAVADGMGGHKNGALASSMALQVLADELKKIEIDDFDLQKFEEILAKVNLSVYTKQVETNEVMGTTLSAIVIVNDLLHLGHIGDSRVYLYRDKEFLQLSEDHSYFAELIKYGDLTDEIIEQAQSKRNILTRAIGPEEEITAQFLIQKLNKDDIVLLCSDGLYNMVSNQTIIEVLNKEISMQEMCDELLNLALNNGGKDNITVLIYKHC